MVDLLTTFHNYNWTNHWITWRHVTTVALFLDNNKTDDDGDGKENGKQIKCLYLQTTTLHLNHAILNISLPSLHHYDMKLPNFTSPLYGVGKHNTKIVAFVFLNLDNDRYGPKENFAKIRQIKRNWIRSGKLEMVRIDF